MKQLGYLSLLLLIFSCKKTVIETPANKSENNASLGCATCPSLFHDFEDLETSTTTLCDNFTDLTYWPVTTITEEAIIGYSQEETYPISLNESGFIEINVSDDRPGIYGAGNLTFNMNPVKKTARFSIYGIYSQFNEIGFAVNGSDFSYLNADFPLEIEEVTINLDSITTAGVWTQIQLSFTGVFNTVDIRAFESGITELCVSTTTYIEPIFDTNSSIYFTSFFAEDGTNMGYFPTAKTPTGYFGNQGVSMTINFNDFLAYAPSRISFVHAYTDENANLINIQLPKTPLIVTSSENLNEQLIPFNYSAEVFKSTGALWENTSTVLTSEAIIDSIVITGTNMNTVTVGANLVNSELRSICTYYE